MPTWLVLRHIWLSLVFVLVTAASIAAQHVWLDADGKALPFQTDEEITEFMRTANVVNEEPIGVGINQSVRVRSNKMACAPTRSSARSTAERIQRSSRGHIIGTLPTAICSSPPPSSSRRCSTSLTCHPRLFARSGGDAEACSCGSKTSSTKTRMGSDLPTPSPGRHSSGTCNSSTTSFISQRRVKP